MFRWRISMLKMILLILVLFYLIKSRFIKKDLKRTKKITIELLIKHNQTIQLTNFSGEYQEFSSNHLKIKKFIRKYQIEDIYFILTTNTERIRYSIDFIKFWLKSNRIKCFLIFQENDFNKKKSSFEIYLENNQIHCQIVLSKIQRFEQRYFYLTSIVYNYLQKQNQTYEYHWFAICDDDTLWFIDNLLLSIQQYNSSQLIYLGNLSDNNETIQRHGNYYAYGGAGILLSKSLIPLLDKSSDICYETYLKMYGGDEILGKCLTEILNINLTQNEYFHQIDHAGDLDGLFQSGFNHLITLHHMFTLWEPFPQDHLQHENDILNNIYSSYRLFQQDFLKRYFRINFQTNQTYLLTNGYSFTIFNQILSEQQLNQVELTWDDNTYLYRKLTRQKHSNKINFFFKSSNQLVFYQFKRQKILIKFHN